MIGALRFFRAASRERSVFGWALFWVTLYRFGLWVLPFSMTKKWAVEGVKANPKTHEDQIVGEIVRGVTFASRYVPRASCLTQALAARKLLGYYGHTAELKIGVAKSRGDFEAHAWLEIDGRIVLGKQRMHSRYVVLRSSATTPR